MLSYGALPLSFKIDDETTVSAALGGEQLHGGLIAGAIGLALVVLYLRRLLPRPERWSRWLSLVRLGGPDVHDHDACSARPSGSR